MLVSEARWLGKKLSAIVKRYPNASTVLNLGSQTREFREITQPHVQEMVFSPIENLANVIHADLQEGEGIDVTLDITSGDARTVLREINPGIVIASNLLEHVTDLRGALQFLRDSADFAQFVIVTGPRHYPLHPDPIDNGFRPGQRELQKVLKPLILLKYARFFHWTALTASCSGRIAKQAALKWWLESQVAAVREQRDGPSAQLLRPVTAFGSIFGVP